MESILLYVWKSAPLLVRKNRYNLLYINLDCSAGWLILKLRKSQELDDAGCLVGVHRVRSLFSSKVVKCDLGVT